MKEFAEVRERMELTDGRSRHFREAAGHLRQIAEGDLKIAQKQHDRLVELRDGMLKEALAREDLVICGDDDHRVMDEVEPGQEQPTGEELGIIKADQAELYYVKGMRIGGIGANKVVLGFNTQLEYACKDHRLEDQSSPSQYPELSTEPAFLISRVTQADGRFIRTLDQVDISDEAASLDPIMDVLNERNRGIHHKDMTIEIYRHFGLPDLPLRPW